MKRIETNNEFTENSIMSSECIIILTGNQDKSKCFQCVKEFWYTYKEFLRQSEFRFLQCND